MSWWKIYSVLNGVDKTATLISPNGIPFFWYDEKQDIMCQLRQEGTPQETPLFPPVLLSKSPGEASRVLCPSFVVGWC